TSLGPREENRAAPSAIFFPKPESDFAALARRRAFPLGHTTSVITFELPPIKKGPQRVPLVVAGRSAGPLDAACGMIAVTPLMRDKTNILCTLERPSTGSLTHAATARMPSSSTTAAPMV